MKSAMLSRYLILFAVVILAGVGCKKIQSTSNTTTTTITTPDGTTVVQPPGKGGNAAIAVTPRHGSLNIDSCLVFIKYDAAVVPKDGIYDDSVWANYSTGTPIATFKGLKPGNYYLFGRGWNLRASEKVRGGLPFIILEENATTTHTLVLPIETYE